VKGEGEGEGEEEERGGEGDMMEENKPIRRSATRRRY